MEDIDFDKQVDSGKNEKISSFAIKSEDCDSEFSNEVQLREHVSISHPNVGNVCNLWNANCGSSETHIPSFHSGSNLKSLIKCENDVEKAVCKDDNSADLTNIVKPLKLMCKVCDKAFSDADLLRKHQLDYHENHYPTINEDYSCGIHPIKSEDVFEEIISDEGELDSEKIYGRDSSNVKLMDLISPKEDQKPPIFDDDNDDSAFNDGQSKRFILPEKIDTGDSSTKKDFQCNICNRSFKYISHLKTHKRTHSRRKSVVCNICQKVFKSELLLRSHQLMRGHMIDTPTNDHKCECCNKSFEYSTILEEQKITLLTEKPILCKFFKNGFPCDSKSNPDCDCRQLAQVQLQGTNFDCVERSRNHRCDICDKTFKFQTKLKQHKRTHLYQFVCKICDKYFFRSGSLRNHQLKFHNIDLNSACAICGESFSYSADLKSRVKTHTCFRSHRDILNSNEDLVNHEQNHTLDVQLDVPSDRKSDATQHEQLLGLIPSQSIKTEETMVDEYLKIEIKEESPM